MKKEPFRTYLILATFFLSFLVGLWGATYTIANADVCYIQPVSADVDSIGTNTQIQGAQKFQVTADNECTVTAVSLNASIFGTRADTITITLHEDNGAGTAPGDLIETGTDIDPANTYPTMNWATSTFAGTTVLEANTDYWVKFDPDGANNDSNFFFFWRDASAGGGYLTANGSSWTLKDYDWAVAVYGTLEFVEPPAEEDTATTSVSSVEQVQTNLFYGFVIYFVFMCFPIWLFRKK